MFKKKKKKKKKKQRNKITVDFAAPCLPGPDETMVTISGFFAVLRALKIG